MMTPRDTLQALAVVVIWGVNFAAIKTSVTEIPPITLTILRFVLTACFLLPFFRLDLAKIRRLLPVSLVLGVGHFGLFFIGFRGSDAATVALLLQLGVPFSSILAAFFFKDRLGWKRAGGMAFAFLGAGFVIGEPQGGTFLSMGAVIACAFCWAWANVLIKQLADIPPLAIMGWCALLAIPFLMVLSFFWEENQWAAIHMASWVSWGCLLYTVIGSSIIAYHLWYSLIGRLDVNMVVPYLLLVPIMGVGAGVMLLGETFSMYKMVGGTMTILGVGIIQLRNIKKKRRYEPIN